MNDRLSLVSCSLVAMAGICLVSGVIILSK